MPIHLTALEFSRWVAGYFSWQALFLFTAFYFLAAVYIYGVAVPSGLFVPGMLMGGGLGRFVGELIYALAGESSRVDPGLYALVGAASVLGGVTRMTMSLVVICLEISNDIDLIIPVMLAVGVAKQVGDQFNHSMCKPRSGSNPELASLPPLPLANRAFDPSRGQTTSTSACPVCRCSKPQRSCPRTP